MSAQSPLAKERKVAIDAVRLACTVTSQVFQNLVTDDTLTKKDKSPVTIGDFSAQAVINMLLLRNFPDDVIVGEEDSKDLRGDAAQPMRTHVVKLVNEALQRGNMDTVSDTAVLDAIDRGDYAGGAKGRAYAVGVRH